MQNNPFLCSIVFAKCLFLSQRLFCFLLTIVKVYFICPIFVIVLVWSKCHFVVPRVRLSLLLAFLTGIFLLLVSDKKQKWKTKINRIWKNKNWQRFSLLLLLLPTCPIPNRSYSLLPTRSQNAEIHGNKKMRNSSSPRSSGKVKSAVMVFVTLFILNPLFHNLLTSYSYQQVLLDNFHCIDIYGAELNSC